MNRKYLWLGVGLVVGVALVIGLVLFNQVYYSVGLAFSSLQLLTEVQSDLLEHHLRQANLLFIRAEQLLRIPSHPLNSGHLAGALTIAYSRISSLGLALRPGEIVIWMILLALTVGIFWIEEQRIDRLQEERKKLYSQWMAITTAWTGNHILTHSDQVITKVLEQVKKEINLDGVEIWRWRSDPHNALSVFSSTNVSLLHESLPVPQIFLEAHMGLLGQVILKQQPIYSEEYSDAMGVLPGLRIANVALLPLYMQDNLLGFFILWRGDHGWYYQHRDALTIIAMQISTMLTHAELEKQARQADVYQQMAKARS
ncbi:MAG: GAF domain-containing protein, partial [Firmicutes bacterium]|nr:GAF domain-containing protein [Bacillota bacterium]